MKTNYDCIPCFIRQTLDSVKYATSDQRVWETTLREVLKAVSIMDLTKSPPVMAQHVHRTIRKFSGNDDPYREIKEKYNTYMLEMYPLLKEMVENSSNCFGAALRLAIAGNIIDFGANLEVNCSVVNKTIELSLSEELIGDIDYFNEAVCSAKSILYIGDNAGEIVFDSLLVQQLPMEKVTFVVRGNPVLNDITIIDAMSTGMTELVNVIDNGSDAPGTVLEDCSDRFKRYFQDADIVIAKGQGNFETLSGVDKKIFFLLKAKCHVIAQHIGCNVGDSLLLKSDLFKPE
ncbi:ARMT1-like domain-containing protein [Desulfobacterales bacterium HSG16]|nr:ARMT1-like domain-containing protein [Desulfobacterales bacterium HSG16]